MTIVRAAPMRRRSVLLLLCACPLGLAIATANAQPPQVHGSSDTFASAGVKVAWAVERGATEATAEVVIGLAVAGDSYQAVSVVSIDPFSHARQPAITALARGARLEVRIPRARFADFPRTELHFYRSARNRDAGEPALVVYYLGVPDTTPEFADPGQLDRYLAQRLDANER
jgi:hypothetical protein